MQANILVVDDNRNNLRLLHNILTEHGYLVRPVSLGSRAVAAAKSKPPDVILLDIMMPEMDGYAVCRALKADERTSAVPIIFISALHETIDQVKAFSLGGVDFITKPFQPEELLARVKTHLELKCAREAIEEQKQRLHEQNQELIDAARLREDVERIIRHDLKTPLSAVIGYPQRILQNAALTTTEREYLKTIEEAGRRMLRTIDSSLDLFKMERGVYQLQPVSVNIPELLRRVERELAPSSQEKRVTVGVFVNGHPRREGERWCIWGEELLCDVMLANLIKNAIEASPAGGQVTVSLSDAEAATIKIHNNGRVSDGIYEKFFEKYVTSKQSSKGTGLGTYSAKLIAETQNGVIEMASSEQDGTTVTIRFPKSDCAPEDDRQHAEPPSSCTEQEAPVVPPPLEQLTALSQMAKIGDILGIEAYAKDLETQDETYSPFVATILRLRKTFQLLQIQEYLREFMERECL